MNEEKKEAPCAKSCLGKAVDYGKFVATDAINEMDSRVNDVESFIGECRKKGRNPLEVAEYLSLKKGIDPSGDPPNDPESRKLYDLIRGVIISEVQGSAPDERKENDDEGDRRGCVRCPSVDYGTNALVRAFFKIISTP